MKRLITLTWIFLALLLLSSTKCSASMSEKDANLINQTCRCSNFYKMCISSLQSDPRSLRTNVKGLAHITLELVLAKASKTLMHVGELFKTVADPLLFEYYGTCIEEYHGVVTRHLPEAISALGSKDYVTSKNDAVAAAISAQACEEQFTLTPFPRKSPFTRQNRAVHHLSLVASSIINTLG